jgi:hypothetical protein
MKVALQRLGVALSRPVSEAEGSIRTSPGKQTSAFGAAEKVLSFVRKVLKVITVYVCSEIDPSVVADLLVCCRAALCELPLAPSAAESSSSSNVMVLADIEILVSKLLMALLTRTLDSKVVAIPVVPAKDTERINGLLGTSSQITTKTLNFYLNKKMMIFLFDAQ